MKKLKKILDIIEKICTEICVILLVVITLSIFYQVIARKLGFSVTWVDETARYAFVMLVFIGTIVVARRGTHIRISSFVDMLPLRIRKITEVLTYMPVAGLTLLFAFACIQAAKNVGDVRFSMLTFIRMSDFYYILSVICVIIAIMVVIHIIEILTGDVTLPDGGKKVRKRD